MVSSGGDFDDVPFCVSVLALSSRFDGHRVVFKPKALGLCFSTRSVESF